MHSLADPERIMVTKLSLKAQAIRTHLVLAHVGGAHEDGEDEVHEEVEGDEGDEEVVRLRRQLRLVQLHREEDRHDPNDLNEWCERRVRIDSVVLNADCRQEGIDNIADVI